MLVWSWCAGHIQFMRNQIWSSRSHRWSNEYRILTGFHNHERLFQMNMDDLCTSESIMVPMSPEKNTYTILYLYIRIFTFHHFYQSNIFWGSPLISSMIFGICEVSDFTWSRPPEVQTTPVPRTRASARRCQRYYPEAQPLDFRGETKV